MDIIRQIKNVVIRKKFKELEAQNHFILDELKRLNKLLRYQQLNESYLVEEDTEQTKNSFDYQWQNMEDGAALPSDSLFMKDITNHICTITGTPANWFSGKKIIDVGCGIGRFSYGLLSLGAEVTACDQSSWALQRTQELCKGVGKSFSTQQIDLLTWKEEGQYDMAFCFGVVHHTGNTYLAMQNVANKVKLGGKIFFMIYGFPETPSDFQIINQYRELRYTLRNFSFEERKQYLLEKFGADKAHGWFDQASPRINDLLPFGEINEFLLNLGFTNIRRTIEHDNHHVIADKRM